MREIRAEISENFVKLSSEKAGVRGESNAARVKMTFDKSWDGLAKKVTWWDARGVGAVEVLLTADLLEDITVSTRVYITKIPPEAMRYAGRCTMVIDGCQDDVRTRSLSAGLEVSDAPIFNDPFIENDPTPSRAEQLQGEIDSLLEDMSDKAAEALSSLNAAKAEAALAKGYHDGAASAASRAEEAAQQAEATLEEPHLTSFNGRTGAVSAQAGDYTAQMVGADPAGSAAVKVSKAGDTMTGELTAPALTVGQRLKHEDEEDVGVMIAAGEGCFAAGNGAVAHGNDNIALFGTIYCVSETKATAGSYSHFGFDTTEPTFENLPTDIVGKTVLIISKGKAGVVSKEVKVIQRWSNSALRTEPVDNTWEYAYVVVPKVRSALKGGEGLYSAHAEGMRTAALGETASHSEGLVTRAIAKGAHAEGYLTLAKGEASHAEGCGTIALGQYQHAFGSWNEEDKTNKYIAVAGMGNGNRSRKNAYTLDRSGNGWYAGKVSVGTASSPPAVTADNDLATKAYVDGAIAAAIAQATEQANEILINMDSFIETLSLDVDNLKIRVEQLEQGAAQ